STAPVLPLLASSCPITYSSRHCLISRGLSNLKLGERPVSFLLFFSSWRIWLACVTHLSQIWAWIPEIIRSTSFLLRPQKEQVTSAIKCVFVQRPCQQMYEFSAVLVRSLQAQPIASVPELRQ